jgi:ketosteroid isomerase-like protein
MQRLLLASTFILLVTLSSFAQTATDAADLTKLLNDFLAGASTNDLAIHDRFWADDLIYTRSAGRRVTKAEVMRDVRNSPAPPADAPKTVFTAADIQIQQYGNTAVVAFRLVLTTEGNGTKTVANNLNSGTFVKRDGKWQVVSWQSTRMPKSAEENQKDVTTADASLQQAVLAADTSRITTLTDAGFVWTHSDGSQMSRQQLLDVLSSGKLKYSKLENSNLTVSIFGDTAVVRGETLRQLALNQTTPGTGEPKPFKTSYTLIFVNQGGMWRAVAMHSSGLR